MRFIGNKDKVVEVFKKMATVVGSQNKADPLYGNMSPNLENNIAFQAALDLVPTGVEEPN